MHHLSPKLLLLALVVLALSIGCGAPERGDTTKGKLEGECNAGEASACLELAEMATVEGGEQGFAESRRYHQKACDLGSSVGCFNYAVMAEMGEGGAVDLEEAKQATGKGCKIKPDADECREARP